MVVISSNFSAPVEGVLCEQPSTKLLLNDQEVGEGTLYITEDNVIWGGGTLVTGTSAPTLSLQYRTISLHAVQREPSPALYMVLNYELKIPELGIVESGGAGDSMANDDDEDADLDPEDTPITQLRFIPQNENDLASMYSAMSQGQSLHPDPQDEVEDDPYMDGEEFEEGDEIFEDAEESNPAPEDATSRLRQLNLENTNGHNMHDDADEFEETSED